MSSSSGGLLSGKVKPFRAGVFPARVPNVLSAALYELPNTLVGGGPAGVKDWLVRCVGGGPAGVVLGKRLLCDLRVFGVDGGDEDPGTRNMLAVLT